MSKAILEGFPKGLITPYDIDTMKASQDSLSDVLNCEINAPMMMLSRTPGYATDIAMPTYSGSRVVAVKKWNVERPSINELTILVKTSENMLLMSENFHIDYVKGGASGPRAWQFTAGSGGTIVQNDTDGPVRRAYKITQGASPPTYLRQNFACVSGVTYTFSLYVKTDTTNSITIRINDSSTTTSQAIGTSGGTWSRFTVTKTAGATGTGYVEIDATISSTATYIWGAQLEVGSSATEYGYTFLSPKPYYVWMRPYYVAGSWVDAWRELTEMRCFTMNTYASNVYTPTGGNIRTTGEGDDYFKRWYAQCIGDQASTAKLIGNTGIVLGNSSTTLGIVGGVSGDIFAPDANYHILISRHPHINDMDAYTTYNSDTNIYPLCQGNIDENDITFNDVGFGLSISFYSTNNRAEVYILPMIISYINNIIGENVSPYVAPDYNEFQLTYESPSLNTPGTADNGYTSPIIAEVVDGGAGSLAASYYHVAIVGIYSGIKTTVSPAGTEQKVLGGRANVSLAVNRYLTVKAYIHAGICDPRLIGFDIYVGTAATSTYPGDNSMYYQTRIDVYSNIFGGTRWKSQVDITSVDTSSPTLFANMQRETSLQTYNMFSHQVYVAGRKYTSNKTDVVRYSNIRDVVEEINIFPYDDITYYGGILVHPGSSDYIVALAKTKSNDLMIFKNRKVLVYEVQSGRSGLKRLYSTFDGIGCICAKGVSYDNDYGTFWYDEQGIYRYVIGMEMPERIALGRMEVYWSRYLRAYMPYSFAFFNRKAKEYWIFIQTTGTAGLPRNNAYTSFKVFRYSPIFQNWNVLQFNFTPVSVTDRDNGEIIIASYDAVYKWGYDTTGVSYGAPVPNGYAETQKFPISQGTHWAEVVELESEYDVASAFALKLLLNDETAARSGNSRTFPYSVKRDARTARVGSKGSKMALRVEFGNGDFKMKRVGADVIQLKERYGSAR